MFTIRPAVSSDGDPLFNLAKALGTSFSVERAAFDASFAVLLCSSTALVAVACYSERLVGYVLAFDHPAFFANGRVAWVEEIMVTEEMRRRGVGRQLMQSVEEWAKGRGARLIGVATRRAASFYGALGYTESATYFRKLL